MKTLKIGAIATSGRGRNAWQAHQTENGVEIVAGADVSEKSNADMRKSSSGTAAARARPLTSFIK